MVIKLTKEHKKPNGKIIPKGTLITVAQGHPFKKGTYKILDGVEPPEKKALNEIEHDEDGKRI